jgi:hypothetical protein
MSLDLIKHKIYKLKSDAGSGGPLVNINMNAYDQN